MQLICFSKSTVFCTCTHPLSPLVIVRELNETEKVEKELKGNPAPSEADIEAAKLVIQVKGEAVKKLKLDKASKEEITAAVAILTKAKEDLAKLEERAKLKPGLPKKDGKIDYTQAFFDRQAFLTVSGQLQAESYACALGFVLHIWPDISC